MADGVYYVDTKAPFPSADYPTITLLTTSLMLWPAAIHTPVPAGYFTLGKKYRLELFGRMTTAATPGNLTIEIRLATTDAGGTILATSAATALVASKTSISWRMVANVHCRAVGTGTSGSLFASGAWWTDGAAAQVAAANVPIMIPASAPAAVGVDTTAASGISVQMKRSGSTAETAIVHDLIAQALN